MAMTNLQHFLVQVPRLLGAPVATALAAIVAAPTATMPAATLAPTPSTAGAVNTVRMRWKFGDTW